VSAIDPPLPSDLFVVHCYLPSFPTRRSSDLGVVIQDFEALLGKSSLRGLRIGVGKLFITRLRFFKKLARLDSKRFARNREAEQRSEEHTSELQSRVEIVCRLLLEKNN